MAELMIRAAMNDHLVVSDLLTPTTAASLGQRRPSIDRLVADAHVAEARPALADFAQGAGIPYLIDPNTPLLQTQVAVGDKWAQLPFARADAMPPADIDTARLAAEVVEFQLDKGATVVIPAYFYASAPTDPWFILSLRLIDDTAEYLRDNNVRLPVMPILCAQLQSFGNSLLWATGLDRFLERTKSVGGTTAGLCFS